MEKAKALLDAGELEGAVEQLISDVKANPTDVTLRTFLFEAFCFAGEWERAEKQLDVIGHQSMQTAIGVQAYRNNIKAERDRQRLFTDGLQPHFLSEPPAYVDLLLTANNRLREGNLAEARETLDRAEEERPALAGKLNENREFNDFRDYNDATGSVLELIVKDQYTWLPFEQIRRIEIAEPKNLRDLLWANARIESLDGTMGEVFLPTLYAGSSAHENNQVRLGRMTDWREAGGDIYTGVGMRLFLVNDEEDKALLEVRSVEFNPATEESTSAVS
ncbi:MAG: avirulence locus temperature-dependent protein secretion protein [Pyrinomonadaceae bacterium]|nr:avirulence locus temperature-dependent protein secretion protein [Pyrinomonadaceae bacterium]